MARRHVRLPIAVEDPRPWVHGTQNPQRLVLHDTESHDVAGLTDIAGIFNFWHTQKNPDGSLSQYGAHFVVDKTGNVGRGGDANDLQWHVGGMNTDSIGVEQIGFAALAASVWKRDRRNQLWAVARVLAWAHGEYGIPLKVRSDPRSPGVTTHRLVGAAGIDTSGHTDPGAGYPLGLVLTMAKTVYRLGFKDAQAAMPGKAAKQQGHRRAQP